MKDALVIVNPASAGGRTGRTWPAIAATLRGAGLSFDSALTRARGEATVLTREALGQGWPMVVAAGGDGTTHEVVNGFFDEAGQAIASQTRLGLVPLGTGGDFRRTFGVPTDTAAAAQVLRAARTRRIDVGRVTFVQDDGSSGARVFCNIADAGLGGEVVHRVNHGVRLGSGQLTFLLASAVSLLAWRNRRLRVEADGEVQELTAQQAVVANARYYGGGMCIAPGAEPDDGLLDLVLVGDVGRLQNLRLLGPLRAGTHLEGGFPITTRRVRRVKVEAETMVRVDADGEQPGHLPATFEVIPDALALVVP
ncbi:MAG: diacylglycerol kinase family lipid kinase [Candidatus Dormibacteraeota bacterium]|nr:diacylglycerol kinase family lipid kinase [Candidatus Dormibacteraeota bacterium]